ncbi:MAG: 2-oxoglutarate dehydrogenase complex dihydrolipoyllysine-residue succinyltransferase [Planctomycetota bacterium]|nr:MAG: 2-oxoglutarate dehydrogenase complex dihydrolipoyllysine-residue succinyltransferase [Planctomycetota bacterium]
MPVELKVPHVGESVYEVTVAEWFKAEGEAVRRDEPLVSLETDKASLDVPSPTDGVLVRILKQPGDSAAVGEALATIEEGAVAATPAAAAAAPSAAAAAAGVRASAASATATASAASSSSRSDTDVPPGAVDAPRLMPAARNLLEKHGLRPQDITPTGPGGRLLKEDVLRHVDLAEVSGGAVTAPPPASPTRAVTQGPFAPVAEAASPAGVPGDGAATPRPSGRARRREVVRMTPLRRRIAERLVESQRTTASLTTFNEVDMSAVVALRKEFKEAFLERHGVRLGFMSFFVKAVIEALKEQPALNAFIDGEDLVYNHYYDIGVAVGGGRGLVVPVIRDADRLSFAEIELTIRDFAVRAKKNKLRPDELEGGTFTISNGGVYGSMLSTPILNPPQSGILGMHNIVERPVAVDGKVEVRPVMFVALTYDHRIVDGRESVTFLKRIKHCIEQPSRMLLEV